MVDVGDDAPDFTAPLANGDVESITLSEHLGDGPVVLAFFPGAFTGVCTDEMCAFRDALSEFESVDATVFGVSVDTPFSLNEFRANNDLGFDLVSDTDKEVIDAFGVRDPDFADFGYAAAKRSVFVLDDEGTVTYRWVTDDPGVEPDYEEVREAAADAA
jgi:peroxiredoxin